MATRTRTHKVDSQFPNRVRFNWGYHDAASDFAHKWTRVDGLTVSDIVDKHFNRAYAYGYVYGYNDARLGAYEQNSEQAWRVALAENQVTY